MTAWTTSVWPIGLAAAAVVIVAAAPARAAPPAAAGGAARVVLRSTDLDTGAPLSGARFELWREANDLEGPQRTGQSADEQHGGVCVTDAKGTCTVQLATGETYYWVQTGVPAGYERPDEPFTGFDLGEADAPDGLVLNVANRRGDAAYSGAIQVRKKDGKTGAPLHGAVFELWKDTNGTTRLQTEGIDADQRTRPGCATDADGICDFDRLADGRYFLVETDVSEGYVLPEDPVTGPLLLDGTVGRRLVVTYYNKRHERIPIVDKDEG